MSGQASETFATDERAETAALVAVCEAMGRSDMVPAPPEAWPLPEYGVRELYGALRLVGRAAWCYETLHRLPADTVDRAGAAALIRAALMENTLPVA